MLREGVGISAAKRKRASVVLGRAHQDTFISFDMAGLI